MATTPVLLNHVAKLQAIQAKIKEANLNTGLVELMAEFETVWKAAIKERRRIDEQTIDRAQGKDDEKREAQSDSDEMELTWNIAKL